MIKIIPRRYYLDYRSKGRISRYYPLIKITHLKSNKGGLWKS